MRVLMAAIAVLGLSVAGCGGDDGGGGGGDGTIKIASAPNVFLSVFLAGEAGDPRRVKMVEDCGVVR